MVRSQVGASYPQHLVIKAASCTALDCVYAVVPPIAKVVSSDRIGGRENGASSNKDESVVATFDLSSFASMLD